MNKFKKGDRVRIIATRHGTKPIRQGWSGGGRVGALQRGVVGLSRG